MRIVITEKCMQALRKEGHETVELADGTKVEMLYEREDTGPPPGHRGRAVATPRTSQKSDTGGESGGKWGRYHKKVIGLV